MTHTSHRRNTLPTTYRYYLTVPVLFISHTHTHTHTHTLDIRNHGRSPHADSMLWSEMAGDVVKFLDYEGYDQAQIVGHSLGGKIAMAMALLHPDRVQNLAVVDIAPVNYPPVSEPLLILQVGPSSMLGCILFPQPRHHHHPHHHYHYHPHMTLGHGRTRPRCNPHAVGRGRDVTRIYPKRTRAGFRAAEPDARTQRQDGLSIDATWITNPHPNPNPTPSPNN